MRTVFLDTVGLLALWDKSDQWHPPADIAFQSLSASGVRLVSSPFILLECGNAAARKPYRTAVDHLRQSLEHSGLLIIPTANEWDEAWIGYCRGDGAGTGIVDQFSFLIMRRLAITEAFTNDRHFEAAGFVTLF
ncbi:MAG: type II toxin-antitoxin system VapC family toxin [Pirellulaceae bacterium]|nr:type II toxin-antitoxin system VapC family toxin [Pirellulaceae bacterium]